MDPETGTLLLPSCRVGPDLTRSAFLSSPMGAKARCDDKGTLGMSAYLGSQPVDGLVFRVELHFEAERLRGYSLWLDDPRFGTSWDDYTEDKQLAQRDAHDAWLLTTLGPGEREPSPRGPELRYVFPWGEVWSTFDARGGSTTIGVRFRRDAPPSATTCRASTRSKKNRSTYPVRFGRKGWPRPRAAGPPSRRPRALRPLREPPQLLGDARRGLEEGESFEGRCHRWVARTAARPSGTSVYWSTGMTFSNSGFFNTGTILKAPVGGSPDVEAIVVASGQNVPQNVAVDATHVYWTNHGTNGLPGQVMMATK
jgi:hypothetical protein